MRRRRRDALGERQIEGGLVEGQNVVIEFRWAKGNPYPRITPQAFRFQRCLRSLEAPASNARFHLLNPTMSYFSVDGLVSGIKSHMIEAASKPTDATLRNVAAQSKFAATNPKSAVLSAAPSPDAVPMMP